MKNTVFALMLVLLLLPLITAATQEERNQYQLCRSNCLDDKKISQDLCKSDFSECKTLCISNRTCSSNCVKERINCLKQANSEHVSCQKQCKAIIAPKCLDGTYNLGDTFTSGCQICECKANGKISCKKDAFCNKNASVSESSCLQAGGLYSPLCNGPYFDLLCTQQNFCLCEGTNNYSCPLNYECMKSFVSPNKRTHTINGWKDVIGLSLGDIGICVQ